MHSEINNFIRPRFRWSTRVEISRAFGNGVSGAGIESGGDGTFHLLALRQLDVQIAFNRLYRACLMRDSARNELTNPERRISIPRAAVARGRRKSI